MTDAHFVPRPLPRMEEAAKRSAADQVEAAGCVEHADTAATCLDARHQEQQASQRADSGTTVAPDSGTTCICSGQTVAPPEMHSSGYVVEPASTPLRQPFSLAHLAVPRRRKTHNSVASTEHSSASDMGSASLDTSKRQSTGLCKFFVNTGKCSRGELCPHLHEAAQQQRWLKNR